MNQIQLYSGYPGEALHEELALQPAGEPILLDLLCEGGVFLDPTVQSHYTSQGIDIFTVIHEQCDIASVDPSTVTLWWGNANSQSLYDMWCKENKPARQLNLAYYPVWASILVTNTTDYSTQYELLRGTVREKLFTYLCGEPREHRIEAMNYIYENNLIDSCEWTWVNDFKKKLHPWFHNKIPKSAEGHKNVMERRTFHNPGKEFFDIYDRTYFDLIPETLYYPDQYHNDKLAPHWNPVFFSEKVFRSIYNKRPFLLIGHRNSLKELRKMGFKTFPHIFDESYDSLGDDERIYHALDQLKNLSKEQMHIHMYSEQTTEILNHNYKMLLEYHDQYGNII